MSIQFKQGHEYFYRKSNLSEPIWLTYVQKIKSEDRHILFSSEFPTVDYHLVDSNLDIGDSKEVTFPQILETYVAFSGDNAEKKKAYDILMKRRGPKDED